LGGGISVNISINTTITSISSACTVNHCDAKLTYGCNAVLGRASVSRCSTCDSTGDTSDTSHAYVSPRWDLYA
jgi:hypothetical protein